MSDLGSPFVVQTIGSSHLSAVLALEAEVIAALERPEWLRHNTVEMWQACLSAPHTALGVWEAERLVALAVLYVVPADDVESLAACLSQPQLRLLPSANYKICMVSPHHRDHGLQYQLGQHLHDVARRQGIRLLCSTVSPTNEASIRSLLRLGYRYDYTLTKYGHTRNLYYCEIDKCLSETP